MQGTCAKSTHYFGIKNRDKKSEVRLEEGERGGFNR